MFMCSRTRQIALWLGVAVAFIAAPAHAADTGNGSKNFRVPTSVPNYFSNEAGPLLGPTSETQRGPLYAHGPAAPVAVAPRAVTSFVEGRPVIRQQIAVADPHIRILRGRRGERIVAHHVAVRGRPVYRVVAHGGSERHVVHVAATRGRPVFHAVAHGSSERHVVGVVARTHEVVRPSHAVSRTTRVSSAHHRGRV
jgi:hypothetical protein